MSELDTYYQQLLQFGLMILRMAIYAGKLDWSKLEVEMLHNLPSLIRETNAERHRYYWFVEREIYVERILALGDDEAASRMRTYYEPIWQDMEPVLLRVLDSAGDNGQSGGCVAVSSATPPAASTAPAR